MIGCLHWSRILSAAKTRPRRSLSSSPAARTRSRQAWSRVSPGLAGNLTGFGILTRELAPKRFELLSELVPGVEQANS